jgi:hypothetical protein
VNGLWKPKQNVRVWDRFLPPSLFFRNKWGNSKDVVETEDRVAVLCELASAEQADLVYKGFTVRFGMVERCLQTTHAPHGKSKVVTAHQALLRTDPHGHLDIAWFQPVPGKRRTRRDAVGRLLFRLPIACAEGNMERVAMDMVLGVVSMCRDKDSNPSTRSYDAKFWALDRAAEESMVVCMKLSVDQLLKSCERADMGKTKQSPGHKRVRRNGASGSR